MCNDIFDDMTTVRHISYRKLNVFIEIIFDSIKDSYRDLVSEVGSGLAKSRKLLFLTLDQIPDFFLITHSFF